MQTQVNSATEYRNVSLSLLSESKTNPRRIFEDAALKELASTIRTQGVLSPLLVRPVTENGFEIVFGARRYRAAQIAEQDSVPVRIKQMTDAEVIEAQLIENLQRRDVHPMEEAQGFHALLSLDEPKYSIEQIAARTGKSPAYCAARLKLTELVPAVVDAFYRDEIGVGHALLLAKLQPDQQEHALTACFKEDWSAGGQKAKRILLPVRSLQFWIETNILLVLKDAPFDKRDAQLVPAAGRSGRPERYVRGNAIRRLRRIFSRPAFDSFDAEMPITQSKERTEAVSTDLGRSPGPLIHVHVCAHCGYAARREEFEDRAHTTGIYLCQKCGVEGPLNIEIRATDTLEEDSGKTD
jgi:ParB/RepB/Spo0J family partition protein